MNTPDILKTDSIGGKRNSDQRGSALVIALFVLALISVFVALAMSRTAAEAAAVGNETAEARTMYAAQGSLEMMTRNFNKIFERKLNPSLADEASVENGVVPGLNPQFTFDQELDRVSDNSVVFLTDRAYAGLYAIRDSWRLRTTSTDTGGTQIRLTRNIFNNRIPIFQFGIFYDDDLELFRPPRFSFGGRVHSNRHFFISPGAEGVYFDSRVTAHGHIVTQSWRNGYTGDSGNSQTFIKNASGVDRQLLPTQGSVLNGTPNVFSSNPWIDPDLPSSRINSSFGTQSSIFDGNLQSEAKALKLPLKVGNANADLSDLIKRGKEIATAAGGDLFTDNLNNLAPVTAADTDNGIMRSERFANKTGIRVSLADSQAKLPGCASGVGTAAVVPVAPARCGVRLDGHRNGDNNTAIPTPAAAAAAPFNDVTLASRGYLPRPMTDGYQATRVNGERLFMGREVWIKIETVQTNDANGAIVTADITEDILSLGVTEEAPNALIPTAGCTREDANNGTFSAPSGNLTATAPQAPLTCTDSRSVIKLQRFAIRGAAIVPLSGAPGPYSTHSGAAAPNNYNYVRRFTGATAALISTGCPAPVVGPPTVAGCTTSNGDPTIAQNERYGHLKLSGTQAVVPFPIQMFDTREGEYFDNIASSVAGTVSRNGVMSLIDIDVANLRRFLRGDFNGRFPLNTPFAIAKGSGLTASWTTAIASDVPQKEGWVFYVSDRRGDGDFDGEYDMEDIYSAAPGNTGGFEQLGEDVNRNTILDAKYINRAFNSLACLFGALNCEAARYQDNWVPDEAAVTDHKYYRRGVRLINGTTLPGIYDSATPANTRGFTVSSENGVYVYGNYNTTGLTVNPAGNINSPHLNYLPQNTVNHIPASIVADAVTILSNGWDDSKSFWSPYNEGNRIGTTTQMRFAMISGDTIASRDALPNQGGISPRLNGGVHNFKRFLERWTGNRLDYSGSLINLFNSKNNNGSFKCCNTVYDPPIRNWVFDATFLDPGRIPPGTPFFQYVQTTGFERSTE